MADEASSAGTVAPAAPPAVPATPAAATEPVNAAPPVAPAPSDKGEEIRLSSRELQKRLEETRDAARTRFLKDLGFEKPDDLKAVLKAAKDAEDAKLSEIERLRKQAEEYKPRADRAAALEKQLATIVESQFNELPDNVRSAIDDVANGNAEERLRMMDVFRKSGLLKSPVSAQAPNAAPAQAPAAPPPPAANTAGAPPPKPAAVKSKFDEWRDLEATNPVMASIFYTANKRDIDKSRPASS